MTPSVQDQLRSAQKDDTGSFSNEGTAPTPDVATLQRALQEQRRATTLARAQADEERQLREALEAQLLEANAEIVASWDRRKEMSRVMGELQARLAQVTAERKDLHQQIAKLEQVLTQRNQVIANREEALAKRDLAISKRDVALSGREAVIQNRDQKIRQLKAELQVRYEEMAALQRNMVESTVSGRAKRLARKARGLARKTFQG